MKVSIAANPECLNQRQRNHYFRLCEKARNDHLRKAFREIPRKAGHVNDLEYKIPQYERYIDLLDRYHMKIKNLISSGERKTNPSRLCIGEESEKRVREIYRKIESVEHLLSRRLNIEVDDIYYLNLCNRSVRPYRQAEAYRRSDRSISKRVKDYKKHHPNTKISI